jgi:hypothetical protein
MNLYVHVLTPELDQQTITSLEVLQHSRASRVRFRDRGAGHRG